MTFPRFRRAVRASLLSLLLLSLLSNAQSPGAKKNVTATPVADNDHEEERAEWFSHGRKVPGKPAAELRHRAYQVKMQARAARLAQARAAHGDSQAPAASSGWTPLGPVPLTSDATGTGFQDYHQVAGRATAVAIDPGDATGNTIYIGGAQGGVWKSTNAATSIANNVTWTAVTDDQATLSIGSLAIQPGNSNPTQSVILVGTGEADNSGDSYFGLGILRSADGGNTWALIPAANARQFVFQRSGRHAHGVQHHQWANQHRGRGDGSQFGGRDRRCANRQHLPRPLHFHRRRANLDLQRDLLRRTERGDICDFGGVQHGGRIVFCGVALSRLLFFP